MTLPVSPNSISMAQVNVELGKAATTTSNLWDFDVSQLFGTTLLVSDLNGGFNANPISLSEGWSKSNAPPVNYTISFGYNNNRGTYLCKSDGSYGTLTPAFSYRGVAINDIQSSTNGYLYLNVVSGFQFTTLTIAGVAYDRSIASYIEVGGVASYGWTGLFASGPYAMTLEG